LTLFAEDSRASLSVMPGSERARTMTVTSGLNISGLYKRSDPVGLLAKMLLASSAWASTKCFLTWKVRTTPAKRLLFQLVPSTPRIEEIESGSSEGKEMWPTPRVSDTEGGIVKNVELHNGSYSRKNKKGVRWGVKLKDAVNHSQKMWPTPGACEAKSDTLNVQNRIEKKKQVMLCHAVRLWPTPKARDHKDGRTGGDMGRNSPDLGKVVGQSKTNGALNPNWVEWLMGFPTGWTDLNS